MNPLTNVNKKPLAKRAFILDTTRVREACESRKKGTQLARDCELIAEEFLHFHAGRGREDFILHHRNIALDLRMSEGRVRKAIQRLSEREVIQLTQRQTLGHSSQWKVNPAFANRQETSTLQRELAIVTAEAQKEVLHRHLSVVK